MKMKSLLALICVAALSVSMFGCGRKTEKHTEEDTPVSQEAEQPSDGVTYGTAYLDCCLKGETDAYAALSGQSSEDLAQAFADGIEELASRSLGGNQEAPGSDIVPPDIYQNTVDLWKDISRQFRYEVTAAEESADSYTLSVETRQMKLYTAMGPILLQKTADPKETAPYAQLLAESLQEAFPAVTYGDPETVTVTLHKDEENHYSISEDDMTLLKKALLDTDSADAQPQEDPDQLGEGAPNTVYPDDLNTTDSYQVGDTVSIQQNGQTVASLTIDKVETTDERADYNETNPDKVVIITYTYQNLKYEEPLLYDAMSFRLLEDTSVCAPYYLESLTAPALAESGGDKVTASLAYGVSADCRKATIYVEGIQIPETFQVTADIP